MTKQVINIGTADKGNGDPLRTAFNKINQNFTELYNATAADVQIPSQTNNSGKYLTTNGTDLSWATVDSGSSDRLVSGDDEFVLVGGANPYVMFPEAGGAQLGIQGSEILSQPGSNGLALTAYDGNILLSTHAGQQPLQQWVFDRSGTINTPLLLPITFTAVFDAEHKTGDPIVLTAPFWESEVQFQVSPSGSIQTMFDNAPHLTNPGYESGQTFRYTEADHGIPDYVLDITLTDVEFVMVHWTANIQCSPPPTYPSTIKSSGAVKLTANESSLIVGTGGSLYLANGSNVTIQDTGGVELVAGPGDDSYSGLTYEYRNWIWVGKDAAYIETSDGFTGKSWSFTTDGKLRLPVGGDIVNSNGNSVLGGGFGSDPMSLVNGPHTFSLGADGVLTLPGGTDTITSNTGGLDLSVLGMDEETMLTVNLSRGGALNVPSAINFNFLGTYTGLINAQPDEIIIAGVPNTSIRIAPNDGANGSFLFGTDGSLTFPDDTIQTTAFQGTGNIEFRNDSMNDANGMYITNASQTVPATAQITLSGSTGTTELYNIYLETEALWELVRDEDAAIIQPDTRPWMGMPSYLAYPEIMSYMPPGLLIDPPPNLVVIANTAKGAYEAWQTALEGTGVSVNVNNNNWSFNGAGHLTFPDGSFQGTAFIGLADSAKGLNKNGDITVAIGDGITLNKQWSFSTEGIFTLPEATDGANIYRAGDIGIFTDGLSGGHRWTFDTDGNIRLPNDAKIKSTSSITGQLEIEVPGGISEPQIWRFTGEEGIGALYFPDGGRYIAGTLYGAEDSDLEFIVSHRPTISKACYIGSTDQFVADIEFDDDVIVVGIGWTVEIDGTTYTVDSIPEDTPANQFRLNVPGATFVTNETYTFKNPTSTDYAWTIRSQTGGLIGPGGAIVTNETAPLGEGTYRELAFELPTADGLNEKRWVLSNDGTTTFPGDSLLEAPLGSTLWLYTSTDNDANSVQVNSTNINIIAENISAQSWAELLLDNTNTAHPEASIHVQAGGGGTDKIWTFNSEGTLTFPDSTTQTGRSVTVPINQTFDFNLSRSSPMGFERTISISSGGLATTSNRIQLETTNSKYWTFNSYQQRIEYSDSTGFIKFGTATKDGTGATNDIELFSYGSDNGEGAVYISAGTSPTLNRWTFDSSGNLTVPGDITTVVTAQIGSILVIPTNVYGAVSGMSNSAIRVTYNADIISTFAVGDTITFQDTTTATILEFVDLGNGVIDILFDPPNENPALFPLTLTTTDYVAGSTAPANIVVGDNTWSFKSDGKLLLPGGSAEIVVEDGAVRIGTADLLIAPNNQIKIGGDNAFEIFGGPPAYSWSFSNSDSSFNLAGSIKSRAIAQIGQRMTAMDVGGTNLPNKVFGSETFTGGVLADIQVGWTVSNGEGWTVTVTETDGYGQLTVDGIWDATEMQGSIISFTSPDYVAATAEDLVLTAHNSSLTLSPAGVISLPNLGGSIKKENYSTVINGPDNSVTIEHGLYGDGPGYAGNGVAMAITAEAERIQVGWTCTFSNGPTVFTVTQVDYISNGYQLAFDNYTNDVVFPMVATSPTVSIKLQPVSGGSTWTFGDNSTLTFPNGTVQTTAYDGNLASAIKLGFQAGYINQSSTDPVAVGNQAGRSNQGAYAVSVGANAGSLNQGTRAIAIGVLAGDNTQGANAIAIGSNAGNSGQGANAIAIGYYAGLGAQHANSIVLNATGSALNGSAPGFHVAPVRNQNTNNNILTYDTTTNEIAYRTDIRVEGEWTVTTGTNNYSFTVPVNGTYTMWVRGNIPNGIIVWNATVTITNSNVPVVGQQFAWVYDGAGNPLDFTSIPSQIVGTAGTILRSYISSGTTNEFIFGIANTSGASQTVYYGYTKI